MLKIAVLAPMPSASEGGHQREGGPSGQHAKRVFEILKQHVEAPLLFRSQSAWIAAPQTRPAVSLRPDRASVRPPPPTPRSQSARCDSVSMNAMRRRSASRKTNPSAELAISLDRLFERARTPFAVKR